MMWITIILLISCSSYYIQGQNTYPPPQTGNRLYPNLSTLTDYSRGMPGQVNPGYSSVGQTRPGYNQNAFIASQINPMYNNSRPNSPGYNPTYGNAGYNNQVSGYPYPSPNQNPRQANPYNQTVPSYPTNNSYRNQSQINPNSNRKINDPHRPFGTPGATNNYNNRPLNPINNMNNYPMNPNNRNPYPNTPNTNLPYNPNYPVQNSSRYTPSYPTNPNYPQQNPIMNGSGFSNMPTYQQNQVNRDPHRPFGQPARY